MNSSADEGKTLKAPHFTPPTPNSSHRILVVDDQPIHVRALYEIFRHEHQVLMATSGQQALKVCQKSLPELILLDVEMQGMNGIEVCRHLKQDAATREIPIIFVTAKDSSNDEARGLEVGAVDFISKPINPDIVKLRVNTHLVLAEHAAALRTLSLSDGLTGVGNRRAFDERLELEWEHAKRQNRPISIILLDIDFFKPYNDTLGHQAGDDCLRQVADVLRSALKRSTDLVARYGGEEFVMLLPGAYSAQALVVAERAQKLLSEKAIPHPSSSVGPRITFSAGLGATTPQKGDSGPHQFLESIDAALYRAKEAGRNRVVRIADVMD